MVGYCKINPAIDTIKDCKKCFEKWPVSKGSITRAICKGDNWIGKVDESTIKENNNNIHENYTNNV